MMAAHEIASWLVTPLITGVIGWILANNKNNQETKAKKLKREMALRKKAFLDAVESLQDTIRYLANFAHMGISNDERMKSYESTLGAVEDAFKEGLREFLYGLAPACKVNKIS